MIVYWSGFACVEQGLETVVLFMAAVEIQSTLKWFCVVARHVDKRGSALLFTMH